MKGWALCWRGWSGAVYSPFATLRDKHFRHHIERADILAVNYRVLLVQHPMLDRCVRWGSWLFLPAVDLLLQGLDVLAPLYLPQRRHLRTRNLFILAFAPVCSALCFT